MPNTQTKGVYLPPADWEKVAVALTETGERDDHADEAADLFRIAHIISVQTGGPTDLTVAELVSRTGLPDDTRVFSALDAYVPSRAINGLLREHYATFGDLKECSDSDLLNITNFGERSLTQVKNALRALAQEPQS